MKNENLRVELVPVKKLKVAKYNPRKNLKPGDDEWDDIKRSIQTHGLVDPLIWNEVTGNLIGGHQRLKVLVKEFGATAVPCSIRRITNPKAEMALNTALNKVSGEWDFEKLKAVILTFDSTAEDAKLRASMGYDTDEIKNILAFKPTIPGGKLDLSPEERLPAYEAGVIKQIVLYFPGETFPGIIARLDAVSQREDVDDNTAAFLKLLEFYENAHPPKKTNPKKAA